MPYINAKLSGEITKEKETELKSSFGEAIALFPGKSETYLMCNIESGAHLWFGGKEGNSAFVEVELLGNVNSEASASVTQKLCTDIEKITGIPSGRIYVRYTGGRDWGWNGSNF